MRRTKHDAAGPGQESDLLHFPLRYNTEDDEDDEDDEDEAGENAVDYKSGAYDFNVDMLSDGIAGMDLHGTYLTSDKDEDPYAVEESGENSFPALFTLKNGVTLPRTQILDPHP